MRAAPALLPAALLAAALAGLSFAETVEPRMVEVLGEGLVQTTPNEVTLLLSVVREDPKPSSARELMASAAAEVISTLKKAGIPARNIQTAAVSLQAQYKYDRGNSALTGYRASTTITVKLLKVDAYDEIVLKALAAGANELAGATFSHSRRKELEKEARKKAVEDASEKAKLLAQEAGARIGRVHRISEEISGPRPYAPELRAMGAAEASPLPSIAQGEIVVKVTVRVSWELLD